MKALEAAETVISNKVRAVFQHPSGYTTVLHKEDNRLYLYEQRHMSIVGTSKTVISSVIELLTFSNNFNVFYVVCKEGNHQRQLKVFELNEMGQLASDSMEFRKNTTVIEPHYLCMAPLQTKDQQGNEAELLICLDANTYSFVTNIGRIIKQEDLFLDGQNIKTSKIKFIKESKFLICSENKLLSANIDIQRCQIKEELKLQDIIRDIFIDRSKFYIAVYTTDHKIYIISSSGGRFRICFDFSTQSLNVSDACFFRPGVNTSANNKYKDRLYIVFQVLSNNPEKLQERRAKRNAEFINMSTNYTANNLYFYQFRESSTHRMQQFPMLKAFQQFCIQGVGKIRSLFASSIVYNSVLALNHQNKATSYNLIHLLSSTKPDKEWIYLSFKFQACVFQKSVLYDQRENQFEGDLADSRPREISEEELNDWSDSALTSHQIQNGKKHRIKCLDF